MRNKVFDYSFMVVGLIIQVVTYFLSIQYFSTGSELSIISLISGCLGVCSVCLTAQGSIWTFLFGFAQIGTYTYLCLAQRFYGEIAINAYYFATMIYGVFVWGKRAKIKGGRIIAPRHLPVWILGVISATTLLVSWFVGWGLAIWTDDTQPYLDAFTTIPALVAQILMILVYREHWYLWLAVDVLSVALWLRAGDYCMTAQYAFWCANCIYGLQRWKKLEA